MRVGILSDTHDELIRAERAVRLLKNQGADVLIHCGDLSGAEVVSICSILPFYFVFGNWDADNVPILRQAAVKLRATCLEWGGVIELANKKIGIVHGHMRTDLRRVLATHPNYLLSGHSHIACDQRRGAVRRINPGALHDAEKFTIALLDLKSDECELFEIQE